MIKRVMMIAGEASGDLHGSGVVRELLHRRPDLQVYGVGGDRMQHEGMELLLHSSDVAFMGFLEVLMNLPTIRRVERQLRGVLRERRPDVVLLIDYPGFNLRFAGFVHRAGIPVLYYISPQVWAWHRRRVGRLKKVVKGMKVVFPFEVDFYRQYGMDVEFVGHPLAERIGSTATRAEFCARHGLDPAGKLIGLFPGSRLQEIQRILPAMLDGALDLRRRRGVQVAVSVSASLPTALFREMVKPESGIVLVEHTPYDLMQVADAAAVTSGTATLEAGWFGLPMVIVYKTSGITYGIGRALVRVSSIGLANIVAGSAVVPELLQGEVTGARLSRVLERLVFDQEYASAMRRRLAVIKEKLGPPGASARVAESILAIGANP
jgi:lipid-A-disaccharide synthase